MKMPSPKNSQGFTLVELMITVLLAGLLMTAIYSVYRTTRRVHTNQLVITEMQQNIRAAMGFIVEDLRMAGFDPAGSANAGFCTATAGQVQFTQDLNESGTVPACGAGGQPNENITLGFSLADDAGADGVADSGGASFGRNVNGGGFQPIAEDIAAVEFTYILADESSTPTPNAAQMDNIVKVQVSMLARANRADPEFTDNRIYTTASGNTWGPFPDHFRRRLLITTVHCRNLGS